MVVTSTSPSTPSSGPIRRISLPISRSSATQTSLADSMYVDEPEPFPSSSPGTTDGTSNEITSPTQGDLDGLFDDVLSGYGLYTPNSSNISKGHEDGNRLETATENEVGDIPTQSPRFPVLESTLPSPSLSSGTISGGSREEPRDDGDVLVYAESSPYVNASMEAERPPESTSPTTATTSAATATTTTTPPSAESSPTTAAYPPAPVQSPPQALPVSSQVPPVPTPMSSAQSQGQVPPPIASPPSQPQQPPQLQTQAAQTQGRRRPLPQPPGSGAAASGSGSMSGPRLSGSGSAVSPGSVASPSSMSMLGSMMLAANVNGSIVSSMLGSVTGSPIGTQATATTTSVTVGASSVPTVSVQVPPPSAVTTTSDTVIPSSSPSATAMTTETSNTATSINTNLGTTTTTNSTNTPTTTATTTPRRRPLSQKERDFPQPIVFAPERINPHAVPIPSSSSTNQSMTSPQFNTIPTLNNQTDPNAINPNAVLPTHHPQSNLSDLQRNVTDLQEEVPTEPGSEYPDHDNAFLPRYIRNVEQDPIASRYLGGGPGPGPVGGAGLGADVVMREMSNGEEERYLSYHEGLGSGSSNALLGMSLGGETFMSITNLSLLRRPSLSSVTRLPYLEEEAEEEYQDQDQGRQSQARSVNPDYTLPPQHNHSHGHRSNRSRSSSSIPSIIDINPSRNSTGAGTGTITPNNVSSSSTTTAPSYEYVSTAYGSSSHSHSNSFSQPHQGSHPHPQSNGYPNSPSSPLDWDHEAHDTESVVRLIAKFDFDSRGGGPSYHHSYSNGAIAGPSRSGGGGHAHHSGMGGPGSATLHEFDDIDPYYASTYVYTSTNSELDGRRFMDVSLLSNVAVQLKDKVPRGTHVKGSIPYPRAFTGRDIVSTIHAIISRELYIQSGIHPPDRKPAILIARSLQSLLFFYEVESGARVLQDGVEDVYMFLDDYDVASGSGSGGGEGNDNENSNVNGAGAGAENAGGEGGTGGLGPSPIERTELPTGIMTFLTKCYSPLCDGTMGCYANDCPRRGLSQLPKVIESPPGVGKVDWSKTVPQEVLSSLSDNEVARQTIIHKIISKEEQYLSDLDTIQTTFIEGLRNAQPPLMTPLVLEDFIEEIFSNILEVRECHKRLLEVMYVRQREEHPVIQSVGDIFLDAATEFRRVYPGYVGRFPMAEKRLKEEMEQNPEFRLFLEKCSRTLTTNPVPCPFSATNVNNAGSPTYPPPIVRPDLKHYLTRPSDHLQKYPVLLDAVYRETHPSNPDGDYLAAAIAAIQNLQEVARLRTFQSAMGKGPTGKWEWHDLVSSEQRAGISQDECRRQSVIFELIKGEMAYVRDLENTETMYIRPLRNAEPPIIPHDRLDQFLTDVFHNYNELHAHHRRLVDTLHEIQREEHPRIRSITAAVYDAVLNFREAYMEYIPNYPIASHRIDEELQGNQPFRAFVDNSIRHPDAHRLDLKNFIYRPIPRLLRYELLLKQILAETPGFHDDRHAIPPVIEQIKSLGKDTEPGVASAKQKVELWRFNSGLVFKSGEYVDMDLLNEQRSLIHTGKLFRPPEGGLEWSGWTEMFVMLFDNYLVMTKPRERDGVTKYHVHRRPVPLDLLAMVNFADPAIQRSNSILRSLRSGDTSSNSLRGLRNADIGASTTTLPSVRNLELSSSTASAPASSSSSIQTGTSQTTTTPGPSATPSSGAVNDNRTVYPSTIHHNGRLGGTYTLYAESSAIRDEWKTKLEEALGLRKVVQELNKVFAIESLSVDTFLVPSMNTAPNSAVLHDGTFFTGKVTCSVPFKTPDGRGLVAIGCAEGVWIGYRYDSRSLRRVLHLKMVTQCAVLEDFGLFIVLADKVLYAYHLEALVPTVPGSLHATHAPQRINPKDVQFFSVGVLHGRTMIIYMKKRGNNDSVFHAVEPVIDKINERPRTSGGLLQSIKKNKTDWFRHYKEFTFTDAHDLIFLKARIAVLCAKGFMIMDLADYKSVTIPQRDHPNFPYLAKRCESCRPLGMFRPSEEEFLLCYDEFGLFVDRQGNPSRPTGTIEWEGTAERVAMHAPYVLLFDSRFIEVRHVETGRLVQIIPGNHIRCVWDGRSLDGGAAAVPLEGTEEAMSQEPRVHAVMNLPDPPIQPGTRPVRGTLQHVFELFPTIPLYLPGSLSSPATAPYFPVSFSPPRSPPLRANHV